MKILVIASLTILCARASAFLAYTPGIVGATEDFESLALGLHSSDEIFGGFATHTVINGGLYRVADSGTSTTGGSHSGAKLIQTAMPSEVRITFDTPVAAFGGYFRGIAIGPPQLMFVRFWNGDDFRGVFSLEFGPNSYQWMGVFDTDGTTFTHVDVIADDLRFSAQGYDDLIIGTPTVPEPGSILAMGMGAVALLRRREGKHARQMD